MGLNVALTYQNRSYRDSETKENVEVQKRKQRGENDRKRTATTKNKHIHKTFSLFSTDKSNDVYPSTVVSFSTVFSSTGLEFCINVHCNLLNFTNQKYNEIKLQTCIFICNTSVNIIYQITYVQIWYPEVI